MNDVPEILAHVGGKNKDKCLESLRTLLNMMLESIFIAFNEMLLLLFSDPKFIPELSETSLYPFVMKSITDCVLDKNIYVLFFFQII
jgi:hypothetical protein